MIEKIQSGYGQKVHLIDGNRAFVTAADMGAIS